MQKNNKIPYEIIIIAYLLLNGMSVGHFIADIRSIMTRGFDNNMGVDVTLTLLAMYITTHRLLYWHNKKNENTK